MSKKYQTSFGSFGIYFLDIMQWPALFWVPACFFSSSSSYSKRYGAVCDSVQSTVQKRWWQTVCVLYIYSNQATEFDVCLRWRKKGGKTGTGYICRQSFKLWLQALALWGQSRINNSQMQIVTPYFSFHLTCTLALASASRIQISMPFVYFNLFTQITQSIRFLRAILVAIANGIAGRTQHTHTLLKH